MKTLVLTDIFKEIIEMSIIGTNIKNLRESAGLSRTQFIRICKISMSYLCEIEKGTKHPSIPKLKSICRALKVDLTDIAKCGLTNKQWIFHFMRELDKKMDNEKNYLEDDIAFLSYQATKCSLSALEKRMEEIDNV